MPSKHFVETRIATMDHCIILRFSLILALLIVLVQVLATIDSLKTFMPGYFQKRTNTEYVEMPNFFHAIHYQDAQQKIQCCDKILKNYQLHIENLDLLEKLHETKLPLQLFFGPPWYTI